MGVVYEAWDGVLNRRVAIKQLAAESSTRDPTRPARMMKEAQAAAGLSHPNVVAVYEVGLGDGGPYIAMEYVDGVSASEWLAAGPHRWREILDVFIQAGRGLAAAHAAGIVHRDVKPANLLLGPDRARVADFGIARTVRDEESEESEESHAEDSTDERLTQTGTILGTPRYLSPEQRATGRADARSDQYSFCLSLHEALYGRLPGEAEARHPAARDVPAWLLPIVTRGLAKDPSARHPDMPSLLAALTHPPRRGGLAAATGVLVAFAVVALVLLVDRAPADTTRPTITVGPFENAGAAEHAWVGRALELVLAAQLGADEVIVVLGHQDVARATVRLRGTFRAGASSVTLTGRLEDARSGAELVRVERTGTVDELPALTLATGARVREALRLRPLAAHSATAAAKVIPRDPEATRLYLLGLQLLAEGDVLAARAPLERAAALAPENAVVSAQLAELSRADDETVALFDRATALAAELPREQRLLLEARRYQRRIELEEAARRYRMLSELFPENVAYLERLLGVSIKAADRAGLEAAMVRYREVADENRAGMLLGYEYHLADLQRDHRRALVFTERLLARSRATGNADDLAWAHTHAAFEHWHLGALGEARRELADARAAYLTARGYQLATSPVTTLTIELERAADRSARALAVAEAHLLYGASIGNANFESAGAALAAEVLMQQGHHEAAAARARHADRVWQARCPTCVGLVDTTFAELALAAGDAERAEALLAPLPADELTTRRLRAETLLLRGRVAEALAEARAAQTLAKSVDERLQGEITVGRVLLGSEDPARRAEGALLLEGTIETASRAGFVWRARQAREVLRPVPVQAREALRPVPVPVPVPGSVRRPDPDPR